MAQSNRYYPQLRTVAQEVISAIKAAFDRIYANSDRIDSMQVELAALTARVEKLENP